MLSSKCACLTSTNVPDLTFWIWICTLNCTVGVWTKHGNLLFPNTYKYVYFYSRCSRAFSWIWHLLLVLLYWKYLITLRYRNILIFCPKITLKFYVGSATVWHNISYVITTSSIINTINIQDKLQPTWIHRYYNTMESYLPVLIIFLQGNNIYIFRDREFTNLMGGGSIYSYFLVKTAAVFFLGMDIKEFTWCMKWRQKTLPRPCLKTFLSNMRRTVVKIPYATPFQLNR